MRRLLPLLLVLSACAPALPLVTEPDRAWAHQAFPETDDDLADSRALYATKCSGCHLLVLPRRVPQRDWPIILDKMAPKSRLNDAEHARILRYVLMASRPGQPA